MNNNKVLLSATNLGTLVLLLQQSAAMKKKLESQPDAPGFVKKCVKKSLMSCNLKKSVIQLVRWLLFQIILFLFFCE